MYSAINVKDGVTNFRAENLTIHGIGEEGRAINVVGGVYDGSGTSGGQYIIKNCLFYDNDEGIHTGDQSIELIIKNTGLYNNARYYGNLAQYHNIYIGRINKFVFTEGYSKSAYNGQLLKSRAKENWVTYSELIDDPTLGYCATQTYCSNIIMDFSYGGETYVIGNTLTHSVKSGAYSAISYNAEQRFSLLFSGGGSGNYETPLDYASGGSNATTFTNTRTGHTWRCDLLYGSSDYGFSGSYSTGDKTGMVVMRPGVLTKESYNDSINLQTDIQPGDVLTYGTGSSITVTNNLVAPYWTFPDGGYSKNGLYAINNTFVNYNANGYGVAAYWPYYDTGYAYALNNAYIDRADGEFILDEGAVGYVDVTETSGYWLKKGPIRTFYFSTSYDGAGYTAGDIVTVTESGASGATIRIDTVSGDGSVTGASLLTPGAGYSGGGHVVTSTTGGTGTGFKIYVSGVNADPGFNGIASYDYSLTSGSSSLINAGSAVPLVNGYQVTPQYSPASSAGKTNRNMTQTIDIGAYEYAGSRKLSGHMKSFSGFTFR